MQIDLYKKIKSKNIFESTKRDDTYPNNVKFPLIIILNLLMCILS